MGQRRRATPRDEQCTSKPEMQAAPQDERALAPLARRERAFTLFCQGLRAQAIAVTLGVTPQTVRRWLRADLAALADDAAGERAGELWRAIEGQRAIASAAWDAYEHERAVERTRERAALNDERPHPASQGARYLAVALAAQREAARLQGLYERAQPHGLPIQITIHRRPDGPENEVPSITGSVADVHDDLPSAEREGEP